MQPFHSLFTAEPEYEYIPDPFGRLGQGETGVKPDPEPIGTPSPRFDEFIKAEQSGMGLRDLFGAKPLAIKGPVGPFGPNRRADVGKVETFLSRTGNHDLEPTDGPTGCYSLRLEDAINAFQKANGLKTDGLLNSFGETIRTLAGKLKGQLKPPSMLAPLTPPGQVASAGKDIVPVKFNPGGGLPRTVVPENPGLVGGPVPTSTTPAKDPLEDFRKADRESMRRLEASRKSKPTHRDAERTSGQLAIKQKIAKIEGNARLIIGFAKAADTTSRRFEFTPLGPMVGVMKLGRTIKAYERYLDGKGGVVTYNPKWMLSHPRLREAAKQNEDNLAKWMLGKVKKIRNKYELPARCWSSRTDKQ